MSLLNEGINCHQVIKLDVSKNVNPTGFHTYTCKCMIAYCIYSSISSDFFQHGIIIEFFSSSVFSSSVLGSNSCLYNNEPAYGEKELWRGNFPLPHSVVTSTTHQIVKESLSLTIAHLFTKTRNESIRA